MSLTNNYFEPLSLEATFPRVFHVFCQRWKVLLLISALVYVVGWTFALFTKFVLGEGNDGIDAFSIGFNTSVLIRLDNGWFIFLYCVQCILYYCFACVANGAIVWIVTHFYLLSDSATTVSAFTKAFQRLWPLVMSTIVVSLLAAWPMIGFAWYGVHIAMHSYTAFMLYVYLAMAYAILVNVILYPVLPVIMLESLGPWSSILRATQLSQGQRCYIFGIIILWSLARAAVALSISLASREAYPWTENYVLYIILRVIDSCVGVVFLALNSVFMSVVYFRIRVDKEDLDQDRLAQEIGLEGADDYVTMADGSKNVGGGDDNQPSKPAPPPTMSTIQEAQEPTTPAPPPTMSTIEAAQVPSNNTTQAPSPAMSTIEATQEQPPPQGAAEEEETTAKAQRPEADIV